MDGVVRVVMTVLTARSSVVDTHVFVPVGLSALS